MSAPSRIKCLACGVTYRTSSDSQGQVACPNCASVRRRIPSAMLYRLSLIGAVVASAIGIWLLLAWPRSFESMTYAPSQLEEIESVALTPAASGAAAQPAPTPTATHQPSLTPQATSTPQPMAPPQPPAPEVRRYTVEEGDTLVAIAAYFGVTTEAIIAANGITNSELIRPGDELIIP